MIFDLDNEDTDKKFFDGYDPGPQYFQTWSCKIGDHESCAHDACECGCHNEQYDD